MACSADEHCASTKVASVDDIHNKIRIRMPVEFLGLYQWTFMLWPLHRRSPARLSCCPGVEALLGWVHESVFRRMVVDERRFNPHCASRIAQVKLEMTAETYNGLFFLQRRRNYWRMIRAGD